MQLAPWILRSRWWQLRAPDFERQRLRGGFSYSLDGILPTPATARLMADDILRLLRRQGLLT